MDYLVSYLLQSTALPTELSKAHEKDTSLWNFNCTKFFFAITGKNDGKKYFWGSPRKHSFFQKQVLRYNEYLVDMQVLKISAINVLVPTHIFILKIAPWGLTKGPESYGQISITSTLGLPRNKDKMFISIFEIRMSLCHEYCDPFTSIILLPCRIYHYYSENNLPKGPSLILGEGRLYT